LGDDAEYVAGLGAKVTAFDLFQTAIDWCHQRFPTSQVNYQAVDLFTAPTEWKFRFDLMEVFFEDSIDELDVMPARRVRIAYTRISSTEATPTS
jgi:hypothetical protein